MDFSWESFDASINSEEIPSFFADSISLGTPKPFKIVPYTGGIAADNYVPLA